MDKEKPRFIYLLNFSTYFFIIWKMNKVWKCVESIRFEILQDIKFHLSCEANNKLLADFFFTPVRNVDDLAEILSVTVVDGTTFLLTSNRWCSSSHGFGLDTKGFSLGEEDKDNKETEKDSLHGWMGEVMG